LNGEPVNDQVNRIILELGVSPEQAVFLGSRHEDCVCVRRGCAGVATVEVPSNLGEYLVALSSIPGF
jgi:hypothetical protein